MANTPPTSPAITTPSAPVERDIGTRPTDPAVPQAPPSTIDAAGEDTTPERVLGAKELMDAIAAELDLEPTDYVMIPEFERFTIAGTRWEVGSAPAGRDDLSIFFIAVGSGGDQLEDHVAGDVRAYVRPLTAKSPTEKAWRVYVFNRVQPGNDTMMTMPQATWIDLIAKEKKDLAIALEIASDEEEVDAALEAEESMLARCVDWLRANALDNAAVRMMAQFEAEDDAEGEDEDDGEEDEG